MLSLYRQLIHAEGNLPEAASKLVGAMHLKIGKQELQDELEAHPDFPSLLSLSEVLDNLGLPNYGARLEKERLEEVKPPFIAVIKPKNLGQQEYTVVKAMDGNYITYMNPATGRWIIDPIVHFKALFQDVVLVPDADQEKNVPHGEKEGKPFDQRIFYLNASMLALPVVVATYILYALMAQGLGALLPGGYLIFSLVGLALSTLLLWYEIDQQNAALQQLCGMAGQGKSDCATLLSGKASRFLGLSWSTIGVSYFFGLLAGQLAFGAQASMAMPFWGIFSCIGVLYVPFSLYYQRFVAKQWCPLCLGVQAVLAFQCLAVLLGGWPLFSLEFVGGWLSILSAMFLCLVLLQVLVPVFHKAKKASSHHRELQRLKRNPMVFEGLLEGQKQQATSANGLGLQLGPTNAPNKVIKVCNPYCGPCAKAHPEIDRLLKSNPNVQVQVIFTAGDDDRDRKAPPVRHLLAIAAQGDKDRLARALDDWYLADTKDYGAFAKKYPMNGELKEQNGKLRAMREWCHQEGVAFTPTFYINGYQLPKGYAVGDLVYLLR